MIVKATVKTFVEGRLRYPGEEFEIADRPKGKLPRHIVVVEAAGGGKTKGPNTKTEG